MNQDPLARLGVDPVTCGGIPGRARTRLLNWLVRWEHYEAALSCLEVLLRLEPGRLGLLDAKTEALLGLGRTDEALATLANRHEIGLARVKVRGFRPRRQLYVISDPRHIAPSPAREFLEFVERWRAEQRLARK